MIQTLFSFLLLAAGILVLPFILHYHLKQDPVAVHLSVVYGGLILIGWITALILGQTFKTLPFIVWVKHYEHLTGKVKTPLPADLTRQLLLRIQFMAFVIFLLAFFAGTVSGTYFLKLTGALSLITTAVVYLVQVTWLLLHQTRTEHYDPI